METRIRDVTVLLPSECSQVLRTAASELSDYIKRVTGVRPSVEREGAIQRKPCIYLGHCAANERIFDVSAIRNLRPENDGYVIVCQDGNVHIVGANDRSVLFGIYRFLQDVLGVGFWHYNDEVIPHRPEVSIQPMELAIRAEANTIQMSKGFEERYLLNLVKLGFNAISYHFEELLQRTADTHFANCYGLKVVSGGHCIEMFLPHKRYFKEHPEWYPLREGERMPTGHICFADPEAARTLVDNAVEMTTKAKRNYEALEILSIWPADSGRICQCDFCRSHEFTGMYIKLINEVAKAIYEANIGVTVEYILYNCDNDYYRKRDLSALGLPSSRPEKELADALYAYWGRTYNAPFEESQVSEDKRALELLKDLAEYKKATSRRFRVFEYYADHWMLSTVFPILWDAMAADFKLFNMLGYWGLWSCDVGVSHPDDYPMLWTKGWANFAIGALAWSSQINAEELAEKYIESYYGSCAESARRIVEVYRCKVPPMSRHNLAHPFPGKAGLLAWNGMSLVTSFFFDPESDDEEFWAEHDMIISDVERLANELEKAAVDIPAQNEDSVRRLFILEEYRAWCTKRLRSGGLQLEAQKEIRAGNLKRAKELIERALALDAECGGLGLIDYVKWWEKLPERNAALVHRLQKAGIKKPEASSGKKELSPYVE